jgi:hypothetical protein
MVKMLGSDPDIRTNEKLARLSHFENFIEMMSMKNSQAFLLLTE